VTAVTPPIAAFLVRVRTGSRHIESNLCTERFQRFQFVVFCVGILPLVLMDCFLILPT
jgi:hypothetical protein